MLAFNIYVLDINPQKTVKGLRKAVKWDDRTAFKSPLTERIHRTLDTQGLII